jgi:hypothetical protein
LLSFSIIQIITNKPYSIKQKIILNWKYLLAGSISLIPFLIWNYYKNQWNLSNDLGIGTSQSFHNIINRLNEGSYKMILSRSYEELSGTVMILVILLIAMVIWKIRISKEIILPLMTSGIIAVGIMTVYFLTPNDLVWHLNTSVDRTMLPVNGGIIVACYYMLKKIEEKRSF